MVLNYIFFVYLFIGF